MPAISSNDLARRPAILGIGQLGQTRLGAVPQEYDVVQNKTTWGGLDFLYAWKDHILTSLSATWTEVFK